MVWLTTVADVSRPFKNVHTINRPIDSDRTAWCRIGVQRPARRRFRDARVCVCVNRDDSPPRVILTRLFRRGANGLENRPNAWTFFVVRSVWNDLLCSRGLKKHTFKNIPTRPKAFAIYCFVESASTIRYGFGDLRFSSVPATAGLSMTKRTNRGVLAVDNWNFIKHVPTALCSFEHGARGGSERLSVRVRRARFTKTELIINSDWIMLSELNNKHTF